MSQYKSLIFCDWISYCDASYLLHTRLHRIQPGIQSTRSHQLIVRTLFANGSILNDTNQIRILNGRQSMGNHCKKEQQWSETLLSWHNGFSRIAYRDTFFQFVQYLVPFERPSRSLCLMRMWLRPVTTLWDCVPELLRWKLFAFDHLIVAFPSIPILFRNPAGEIEH